MIPKRILSALLASVGAGVVPRTVAEDMLRYALRSLRAAARRLEAQDR